MSADMEVMVGTAKQIMRRCLKEHGNNIPHSTTDWLMADLCEAGFVVVSLEYLNALIADSADDA